MNFALILVSVLCVFDIFHPAPRRAAWHGTSAFARYDINRYVSAAVTRDVSLANAENYGAADVLLQYRMIYQRRTHIGELLPGIRKCMLMAVAETPMIFRYVRARTYVRIF